MISVLVIIPFTFDKWAAISFFRKHNNGNKNNYDIWRERIEIETAKFLSLINVLSPSSTRIFPLLVTFYSLTLPCFIHTDVFYSNSHCFLEAFRPVTTKPFDRSFVDLTMRKLVETIQRCFENLMEVAQHYWYLW